MHDWEDDLCIRLKCTVKILAGRSELTMTVQSVENHVEIIYIVLDPSFSLNEISKDYIGISE